MAINRYRCKNCGKFVSQNAEICKCCGTENPAVIQNSEESKTTISKEKKDGQKLVECPNCGTIFNLGHDQISQRQITCPNCATDMLNPYCESTYESTSKYSIKRQILGVIVILIIGFNIYRACSSDGNRSHVQSQPSYEHKGVLQRAYSGSPLKESVEPTSDNDIQNDNGPNKGLNGEAIEFKVIGAYDPYLKWLIKSNDGKLRFEYVAEDSDGRSVLKSGDCILTTFGQLKSQMPAITIRNCSITTEKQCLFIGPIDTHYNADYSERPVYGILVSWKDSPSKLYINDTDNPNAFVLLDELEMTIN